MECDSLKIGDITVCGIFSSIYLSSWRKHKGAKRAKHGCGIKVHHLRQWSAQPQLLVWSMEWPGPQLNQGDFPHQLQLAESIPLAIPLFKQLGESYLSDLPTEFLSKHTQRLNGSEGPRLLISISEIIARSKDAAAQIIINMATTICGWLFGLWLARDSYLLETGWSREDYSHQFSDAVQSEVTIPGDRWHIWGKTFWIQHQWDLPRSGPVEAHLEKRIYLQNKNTISGHMSG